jgi:hypothetical protein
VQTTSLRSFFLIDPLFLTDAPESPAKSDANIERHRL